MEEELRALRRARFDRLLAEQHRKAAEAGLDRMSMEELEPEISASRKERREQDAGCH